MVYERKALRKTSNTLRQEVTIKKVIELELKTIIDEDNEIKLKYLFNEWFGYEEIEIDRMKDLMFQSLKNNFDLNMYKVYKIIKNSYNNV